MVFSKRGVAAGLATGLLLLMGALISPASAGLISETEVDATPHWGWASIYGEDGDDDVAAVLLWVFGIALLWPDGHEAVIPPDPPDPIPVPTDPPSGGGKGDDPIVPEASTWALFALGALTLLALRKRQK